MRKIKGARLLSKSEQKLINLTEECPSCNENMRMLFPYIKKATRLITNKDKYEISKPKELTELYNEIFNDSEIYCECPEKHKMMIERLQILNKYQQ